jgi:hypothetical protein
MLRLPQGCHWHDSKVGIIKVSIIKVSIIKVGIIHQDVS